MHCICWSGGTLKELGKELEGKLAERQRIDYSQRKRNNLKERRIAHIEIQSSETQSLDDLKKGETNFPGQVFTVKKEKLLIAKRLPRNSYQQCWSSTPNQVNWWFSHFSLSFLYEYHFRRRMHCRTYRLIRRQIQRNARIHLPVRRTSLAGETA